MNKETRKWISVEDQLPPETGAYILCYIENDKQYVVAGGFHERGQVFVVGGEYPSRVTHWMEYPSPPEIDNA